MRRMVLAAGLGAVVLAAAAGCRSRDATVYHQAELGRDRALVERLVREDGQDVDQRDAETGLTPLQVAVLKGHDKMAATLLELGADPDIRDAAGNTPLHQAFALNHEKIIGLLMAHNADPEARNDAGRAPREMARAR